MNIPTSDLSKGKRYTLVFSAHKGHWKGPDPSTFWDSLISSLCVIFCINTTHNDLLQNIYSIVDQEKAQLFGRKKIAAFQTGGDTSLFSTFMGGS